MQSRRKQDECEAVRGHLPLLSALRQANSCSALTQLAYLDRVHGDNPTIERFRLYSVSQKSIPLKRCAIFSLRLSIFP